MAIKYHGDNPMTIVGIDLGGDPTEGETYLKLLQDSRDAGLKIAAHCAEVCMTSFRILFIIFIM